MEHHQHTHHHNQPSEIIPTGDSDHHNHGDSGGHDKHAGHSVADFWRRFIIATLVSIPVLALSHMIQQWFGFELRFPGDRYVLFVLSTFVFIYGGYPFLKGLYDEVKENAIGMMTRLFPHRIAYR